MSHPPCWCNLQLGMMSMSGSLDKLAQSIADGASINWEEIDKLPHDELRRSARALRVVAEIADHHRSAVTNPQNESRPSPTRSARTGHVRAGTVVEGQVSADGAISFCSEDRRGRVRRGLPRARHVAGSSCRAQALQARSRRAGTSPTASFTRPASSRASATRTSSACTAPTATTDRSGSGWTSSKA